MEGEIPYTLTDGLRDIDELVEIWQKIQPEAQVQLKLVIENRISLLRNYITSNDCNHQLLKALVKLAAALAEVGFQTKAVNDAVLDEIEAMMEKDGIGASATTKYGETDDEGN